MKQERSKCSADFHWGHETDGGGGSGGSGSGDGSGAEDSEARFARVALRLILLPGVRFFRLVQSGSGLVLVWEWLAARAVFPFPAFSP